MTDPIYRLHNFGFGDHWGSLSLLRHMAKASGRRVLLNYTQHGQDFSARIHEISDALAMEGVGLRDYTPMLTNEPATHSLEGQEVWQCPLVRTKVCWDFDPRTDTIAYQFDGESAPEKNPSKEDEKRILSHIRSLGYVPQQLGKHLTVAECVYVCSRAALFVGCCSGMSHLAHSVGVPVYLLEYGLPTITCHRQKQFVICKGAGHFIAESAGYFNVIDRLRGMTPKEIT